MMNLSGKTISAVGFRRNCRWKSGCDMCRNGKFNSGAYTCTHKLIFCRCSHIVCENSTNNSSSNSILLRIKTIVETCTCTHTTSGKVYSCTLLLLLKRICRYGIYRNHFFNDNMSWMQPMKVSTQMNLSQFYTLWMSSVCLDVGNVWILHPPRKHLQRMNELWFIFTSTEHSEKCNGCLSLIVCACVCCTRCRCFTLAFSTWNDVIKADFQCVSYWMETKKGGISWKEQSGLIRKWDRMLASKCVYGYSISSQWHSPHVVPFVAVSST